MKTLSKMLALALVTTTFPAIASADDGDYEPGYGDAVDASAAQAAESGVGYTMSGEAGQAFGYAYDAYELASSPDANHAVDTAIGIAADAVCAGCGTFFTPVYTAPASMDENTNLEPYTQPAWPQEYGGLVVEPVTDAEVYQDYDFDADQTYDDGGYDDSGWSE